MCYARVYKQLRCLVTTVTIILRKNLNMPTRVLFVCLGNICRSPLAEAIFVHKIRELGLAGELVADSCGTANYHIGDMPDPRTIRNAFKNGILMSHLGRQLSAKDLEAFDLILAMDQSNLANIKRLGNASQHFHKISLMRSYDPIGKNLDVPDPYHGDEKDFQEVFEILDRSTDQLIAQLRSS